MLASELVRLIEQQMIQHGDREIRYRCTELKYTEQVTSVTPASEYRDPSYENHEEFIFEIS